MWGESSKECELNCQCSGLITDSFCLDSGNSATKRRREEATAHNFKLKMNPHSLDFNPLHKSPVHTHTPKRRVLGEIQNRQSPLTYLKSPLVERSLQDSPLSSLLNSPKLNTPFVKRSTKKISRIFEERTRFKMSNKENEENMFSSSFTNKLDMCEETRDSAYSDSMSDLCGVRASPVTPRVQGSPVTPRVLRRSHTVNNWSLAKMSTASPEPRRKVDRRPLFDDELLAEPDDDTLHDLDAEFECETFDQCTKYEIISTDSPDIISRGRTTSSTKISAKNFEFGAPIAETEQSTSFNKPATTATRMLNFEDEAFEFTSPETLRPKTTQAAVSVKKSLKFLGDTPTKNILRNDSSNSSIGSMSASPLSSVTGSKLLFPSSSTTSMESGFLSEIEEPFLELDEVSNSPKLADFGQLLSGHIKDTLAVPEFSLKRPSLQRSTSYNVEASRARVSLFPRGEAREAGEEVDVRRSSKRPEPLQGGPLSSSKRRRGNDVCRPRPALQRAFSENAASIISALARSASEPDLIGDFSLPFLLPPAPSAHTDLRAISADTLARLLQGHYSTEIDHFQVIDCRYPYEFEGGHVTGARNLYTPQQILSLVDRPASPVDPGASPADRPPGGRRVLVFHCEYSLERGPKLCRFLRSSDRANNRDKYPRLQHPEVYLLHEGYSAFYARHPALCTPPGYTMMLDPNHRAELSTYRRHNESSGRKSNLL